jgi:hypothetical protein
LEFKLQTADSAISLVWSFDHLSNYYISLISQSASIVGFYTVDAQERSLVMALMLVA